MKKIAPILIFILSTVIRMPSAYSDARQEPSGTLIFVDVQVLSEKTGKPSSTLKREDFLLFEEGAKQEVKDFTNTNRSISLVLLLDLSGSMEALITELREATGQQLRELGDTDEVAIMTFAKDVKLVQGFTRDKQLLADQIDKTYRPTSELGRTQTALHEAIYQGAVYLEAHSSKENARAILAISDGHINQSGGHSSKDTLRKLFETGTALHGLLISDYPIDSLVAKPIDMAEYSNLTGGISVYLEKGATEYAEKLQVKKEFQSLLDAVHRSYRLGYLSNYKSDGKNPKIKIKLTSDAAKRTGKGLVLVSPAYHAR
ncbi:MAG TPA: VWA domain-containing protein [Blastocatellia bacterium]|nr:VWA domain-containing protein [Blastocatellia bacterium]